MICAATNFVGWKDGTDDKRSGGVQSQFREMSTPSGPTVKAKTHFFRNLNLTSVLEPSIDDGVFTGEFIADHRGGRAIPSTYRA